MGVAARWRGKSVYRGFRGLVEKLNDVTGLSLDLPRKVIEFSVEVKKQTLLVKQFDQLDHVIKGDASFTLAGIRL